MPVAGLCVPEAASLVQGTLSRGTVTMDMSSVCHCQDGPQTLLIVTSMSFMPAFPFLQTLGGLH